jgi:hypothetical protein
MDVIGSDMCGQEAPAAVQAYFLDRIEYSYAAWLVEEIRWLIHLVQLYGETGRIGVCQAASRYGVAAVH